MVIWEVIFIYYQNRNYNLEYQNTVAQDLRKIVIKFLLSEFIVASTPPQNKRQIESICDGVSGLLDIVSPPQTKEGMALSFLINAYNLSKYI